MLKKIYILKNFCVKIKKNVTKRYLVLLYYHYILFLDINLDVPN